MSSRPSDAVWSPGVDKHSPRIAERRTRISESDISKVFGKFKRHDPVCPRTEAAQTKVSDIVRREGLSRHFTHKPAAKYRAKGSSDLFFSLSLAIFWASMTICATQWSAVGVQDASAYRCPALQFEIELERFTRGDFNGARFAFAFPQSGRLQLTVLRARCNRNAVKRD